MRSVRSSYNLMAVSALQRETALNVFQTLDMGLMVGNGDYLDLVPRRENNADMLTGMEEADMIYDNGGTAKATFTFDKLQPHQAAFLLAYALGATATAAAGAGYQHTITPIDGDLDEARSNPTFTAAQRLGKTIAKRRFASCAVNSMTITFASDDWVKGKGEIITTGKYDESVTTETVSALDNATTLNLAANGVQGSTAAERLDSVQIVRAVVGGGYQFATVTAVSAATPAVITIDSLGGAGATVDYEIIYVPIEPAWCIFPARVVETPMRVAQSVLRIGGSWDGTNFVGGKQVAAEFRNFEYSLKNNIAMEFVMSGSTAAYAGRCWRDGRDQKITLDRHLREMLLQKYMGANEYFGLHLICEGAEFDTGHKYTLELIFPRLGLLSAPISSDGKRIAEKGDLQVLEDATYGSVIARVKNLVSGFAA